MAQRQVILLCWLVPSAAVWVSTQIQQIPVRRLHSARRRATPINATLERVPMLSSCTVIASKVSCSTKGPKAEWTTVFNSTNGAVPESILSLSLAKFSPCSCSLTTSRVCASAVPTPLSRASMALVRDGARMLQSSHLWSRSSPPVVAGFTLPGASIIAFKLLMVADATTTASEMGLVLVKICSNSIRKSEPGSKESFSSWKTSKVRMTPRKLCSGFPPMVSLTNCAAVHCVSLKPEEAALKPRMDSEAAMTRPRMMAANNSMKMNFTTLGQLRFLRQHWHQQQGRQAQQKYSTYKIKKKMKATSGPA
mmetsp:Transcript_52028/g.113360  ORF Transcript_52028/g.113360 Transcript_52028/m.113360 type:complete len:308 (-) Transcript_52028:394-1317(-)